MSLKKGNINNQFIIRVCEFTATIVPMYKYSVKALPSFSIGAWISVDVVIEFNCLNAALKNAFWGFPITSAVTSAEYSKPAIKQPNKFQYSQMIKANKDKFTFVCTFFWLN